MKTLRNMTRMAMLAACLILAGAMTALAQNASDTTKNDTTKSDAAKTDSNQKVSASDAVKSEATKSAEAVPPADMPPPPDSAGPGGPGGRAGGRGFDPSQMFDQMDTNKDGTVSKAEFEANMTQMRANRGNRGNRGNQSEAGADPGARFRQGMLDRMKEQLGSDDKEWSVLKPQIEKVMELQRSQRGGGMRMGPPGAQQASSTSAQQVETEALRKAVDDKGTKPEDLKKKLTAYREARKKQTATLDAARTQLREILTTRQEAVLVLNGTLD